MEERFAMKSYRLVIFFMLVLSASLACSLLQPSTSPGPTPAETQVAATFTSPALDEATIAPTTTESVAAPTETPEITPESVGLRVVYANNNAIYLWQEGQPPKPITGYGGPIYSLDLSDDGQLVAFTRYVGDVQTEIWAVNINGTNEHLLVSVDDFQAFDPDALAVVPYHMGWVPGSHLLAYNTNQIFDGPQWGLYNDLRLVDADTLAQSTLLQPGEGGEFYYSPDGSQIAITTATTISLINADGSNLRPDVLQYEPVLTYSEYQYYAKPNWLSDSSGLKVIIPPVDSLSDPRPPTTLWDIPLDGSQAVKTGEIITMPFFANSTAYAPDLTKIAYLIESGEPAQNIHELHFVNPDGSGDQIFHAEPQLNFAGWAQDSSHFAIKIGENQTLQTGQVGSPYQPAVDMPATIYQLKWIDAERYLYITAPENGAALYLAGLTSPSTSIDQLADPNAPFDFLP